MNNEIRYYYDAKFEGNILVVGRAGCGKTTCIQNLGKNKMFGEIKQAYQLSKISLSRDREENIRDCFETEVRFKHPKSLEEFDNFLELFQRKRGKTAQ